MKPDPMMELLCCLDPVYPTRVSDLGETLGMRHSGRRETIAGLIRAANRLGYEIVMFPLATGERGAPSDVVSIVGGRAKLAADAERYWDETHGGENADGSKITP